MRMDALFLKNKLLLGLNSYINLYKNFNNFR